MIFEAFSHSFITTEHPSAPQLCCLTLPHFTCPQHLPLPVASFSLQLHPQVFSSTSLEVYHIPVFPQLLYAWVSLLEERVGLEPHASDPSPPCSSSSLCSALKVGRGGGRASLSARGPRFSSAAPPPVPWEDECCCCSCYRPRKLVRKLICRMRVPSAAVLCCLLFVFCCPPAASPWFVPSGESWNLGRKEVICSNCASQMTPWPLRKLSNVQKLCGVECNSYF